MTDHTCTQPGCDRKRENRLYCDVHYRRSLKGLQMDAPIQHRRPRQPPPADGLCGIPDCMAPHRRAGYCGAHYARLCRGTDMLAPIRASPGTSRPVCAVAHCSAEADATLDDAVCAAHRALISKHGRTYLIVAPPKKYTKCLISGCDRTFWSSGMCAGHSQRAFNYRLTVVQLDALLKIERCGICDVKTDPAGLNIDHDHACCPGARSCGECVRGVLCRGCNHGLGSFEDAPERLVAAAAYLSRMTVIAV